MRVKIYDKNKTGKKFIYIDKVYNKDEALEKIVCYCEKHYFDKYNRIKEYCKRKRIKLFKNTFYSKRQLAEIKLLFKKESSILSIIEDILNLTDITSRIYPCFIKNKDIFNVYKSYDKTKERENLLKKLYTNIINILNYYSECNSFSKQALTYLDSLLKIIRPMNYNFDYLILEKKK